MRRRQWGLYAVAVAVLVVGLIWAGVPAQTVLIGLLVLACPLMMLFMHGGHGGGHEHAPRGREADRDLTPVHDHHDHGGPGDRVGR